jgi:hypothetical protein
MEEIIKEWKKRAELPFSPLFPECCWYLRPGNHANHGDPAGQHLKDQVRFKMANGRKILCFIKG